MANSLQDPSKPQRLKGSATGTRNSTSAAALTSRKSGPKDFGDNKNGAIRREAENEDAKDGSNGITAAVVQTTIPAWLNVGIMMSLIFGGCCSNVFALEAIINYHVVGVLITFTQFVFTALFTLPNVFSFAAGPCSFFLAPRAVPLKSWVIYTAYFLSVNVLNNTAFAFKISVPLHIIIRSGGPVASMIIGHLYNSKRYTRTQILAVVLLTIGVVCAALADASAKGKSLDIGLSAGKDDGPSLLSSLAGFTILGLAMVLGAFQGVYADRLYETYGRNNWRESLFYAHAISLPFFIPYYPNLVSQLKALFASPSLLTSLSSASMLANTAETTTMATNLSSLPARSLLNPAVSYLQTLPDQSLISRFFLQTPIKVVYLILNGLTQYVCIRGVHLLSAKSSSLTVTVVLNIRKLVSLILSVYVFGNVLVAGVLVGAVLVFAGGGLYGYEGARLRREANAKRKTQ
ncbi:solute carrier family 35 (UDP-xylose/UDP-N-acetylglucosamine transporter), member B4 [Blastomyces parvus]|uniref:Solute carrier family 35 (UDP-xylose/UDP-N-acetylglucosamine transporter), member B4 n=1 Tax=Blastomyces parvus TaxID=2060905 RepID=A0A2B7XGI7_9EURO|nr:solute carrier family 35 (UDP-xylose/UDP-N-acetylglucosamine transporter), member B4 [Blastomyces parvus]